MTSNRRGFIRALAATAMAPLWLPLARADVRPPWSIGFNGLKEDLPARIMTVTGQIPAACRGTLYRNGPARFERGGQRYSHWFDPDGMVQAFRMGPGGVEHRGRFVRTEKFQRESDAGRFLYNGAGSVLSGTVPARSNESLNVANINVQPFNGELLALWEAGAAYRLNPQTLESRGRQVWADELDGVPFSAHPRFDTAGDLWNIGSAPFAERPALLLYHLAATGELKKWRLQELDVAGYMHDFILTSHHLIALNSSALIEDAATFVDSIRWRGDRASELLVFDREDFSLVARIEVPATFVFHFGNAWQEQDALCFTACRYENTNFVKEGMRSLARREAVALDHRPELVLYRVSVARRKASIESLGVAMEFPSFDRRRPFAAQPLFGVGGHQRSESTLATAVQRIDPVSGALERYDYGDGTIVEEPLFVPGPEGGYLIHSFLDYARRQSGLAVLSARDLAGGPIAEARMDRVLPLGFHGSFVAAA